MLIFGISALLGCGLSAAEVEELRSENQALREKVAALEGANENMEVPTLLSPEERTQRRAELLERLQQRRAARLAHLSPEEREKRLAELEEKEDGPEQVGGMGHEGVGSALDPRSPREQLADLNSFGGLGRALLHRGADGEFDGYRLSAIRRNSLLHRLGLKNGDIVHTANGHSLTSMGEAMKAYASLTAETPSVRLELTRRGERLVHEISLDEPVSPAGEPPPSP